MAADIKPITPSSSSGFRTNTSNRVNLVVNSNRISSCTSTTGAPSLRIGSASSNSSSGPGLVNLDIEDRNRKNARKCINCCSFVSEKNRNDLNKLMFNVDIVKPTAGAQNNSTSTTTESKKGYVSAAQAMDVMFQINEQPRLKEAIVSGCLCHNCAKSFSNFFQDYLKFISCSQAPSPIRELLMSIPSVQRNLQGILQPGNVKFKSTLYTRLPTLVTKTTAPNNAPLPTNTNMLQPKTTNAPVALPTKMFNAPLAQPKMVNSPLASPNAVNISLAPPKTVNISPAPAKMVSAPTPPPKTVKNALSNVNVLPTISTKLQVTPISRPIASVPGSSSSTVESGTKPPISLKFKLTTPAPAALQKNSGKSLNAPVKQVPTWEVKAMTSESISKPNPSNPKVLTEQSKPQPKPAIKVIPKMKEPDRKLTPVVKEQPRERRKKSLPEPATDHLAIPRLRPLQDLLEKEKDPLFDVDDEHLQYLLMSRSRKQQFVKVRDFEEPVFEIDGEADPTVLSEQQAMFAAGAVIGKRKLRTYKKSAHKTVRSNNNKNPVSLECHETLPEEGDLDGGAGVRDAEDQDDKPTARKRPRLRFGKKKFALKSRAHTQALMKTEDAKPVDQAEAKTKPEPPRPIGLCSKCCEIHEDPAQLEAHSAIHCDESTSPWKCFACNCWFKEFAQKSQHITEAHLKQARIGLKSSRRGKDIQYGCGLCTKTFEFDAEFKGHQIVAHMLCPYCDDVSFNTYEGMNEHMDAHGKTWSGLDPVRMKTRSEINAAIQMNQQQGKREVSNTNYTPNDQENFNATEIEETLTEIEVKPAPAMLQKSEGNDKPPNLQFNQLHSEPAVNSGDANAQKPASPKPVVYSTEKPQPCPQCGKVVHQLERHIREVHESLKRKLRR